MNREEERERERERERNTHTVKKIDGKTQSH